MFQSNRIKSEQNIDSIIIKKIHKFMLLFIVLFLDSVIKIIGKFYFNIFNRICYRRIDE
jgi:hypothetical protein